MKILRFINFVQSSRDGSPKRSAAGILAYEGIVLGRVTK